MAGAGYKLFNTGDVLTAAQVNTYLMEQTVMVFADAAARTTALTGVVSEGMISYLKDTNAVEVYNGSAWVASDDPNAIQNTIVDAKGDLITATAADTPARLAVGNDGESIVADSSASTGLRWQGNFAAGKNKIINGDFAIWQRGTSFAIASGYTADRYTFDKGGSSVNPTISQQTFTPGTAPVAGYEGQYFYRSAQATAGTGQLYNNVITQKIEDVRTFAGQTVTLSFWAKSDAARSFLVSIYQVFGSGGSGSVGHVSNSFTSSTSWTRYTYTVTLGSMSGKTIGTGSTLEVTLSSNVLNTAQTWDIWGVQLEAGNTATAFQTATGTLAGELQAAQRYFEVITNDTVSAVFYSTTAAYCIAKYNVPKRGGRTITYPTTLTNGLYEVGTAFRTPTALTTEADGTDQLGFTATGMTGGTIGKSLRGTFGTQITVSSEL